MPRGRERSGAVMGVYFAAGYLDGFSRVFEVPVNGVNIADYEFDEAAARGFQRFADVRGPGVLVESLIEAEEIRMGFS